MDVVKEDMKLAGMRGLEMGASDWLLLPQRHQANCV